jgi:hypothetical protein
LAESGDVPVFDFELAGQLVAIISTLVTLNVWSPEELEELLDGLAADDDELGFAALEALLACCVP